MQKSLIREMLQPLFLGQMLMVTLFVFSACWKRPQREAGDVPPSPSVNYSEKPPAPIFYSYEIIQAWPHDPTAFTQGLLFHDGSILESTGLYGQSTLRNVELKTGRVVQQISIASECFAEGLALIGSHAYQLTWQNHRGFIYDIATFRKEAEFHYEGEGWGLTTDGRSLIVSDGTSQIRFLNPTTFRLIRTIAVTVSGKPVDQLNELEWIKGEIFANVWRTDQVVRIDPSSGIVRGIIDFSHLLSSNERKPDTDVLNGIAYDAAQDRLFVTGKLWPKIFQVRLTPRPMSR